MIETNLSYVPQPVAAPKTLTILGATGSIGEHTVALIAEHPERYDVRALTANTNVTRLIALSRKLSPKLAVIQDETLLPALRDGLSGTGIEAAAGDDALAEATALPCDLTVLGIVGIAALRPAWTAITHGNTLALANKECLVCAGELIMKAAGNQNVTIIPVDSEHNALFQTFDFAHPESVEKIVLTASGGPFYNTPQSDLASVTPEQAVRHPNWSMGAKISVDSATMMNKGLEIIEAYHLFPVQKDNIEVIIHPESIVHSLVYYKDGGIIAGMSIPDMRVPIAFALGWPQRIATRTPRLALETLGKLTFHAPDHTRFPALGLAIEALRTGGNAPVVLNAANEIAVQLFLQKRIGFLDIVKLIENALERVPYSQPRTIDDVLAVDRRTRDLCLELGTKRKRA